MISSHRYAAVPGALAMLSGIVLGNKLVWSPPGLLVLLVGLGVAHGRQSGQFLSLAGVGLLLAHHPTALDWTIDLERPVVVQARIERPWRAAEYGLEVVAEAEWLRQGLQVRRWGQQLNLMLPNGGEPPGEQRLRLVGFLHRPKRIANGVPQRTANWQLRVKSGFFVESVPGLRADPRRWLRAMAAWLRDRIEHELRSSDEAKWSWRSCVVRSLVLGKTEALPDRVLRSLRLSGLSHLFALSGLHVGLLAATVLQLTLGLRAGWRLSAVVVLVLLYGLVAGGRPSLVRASVMLFAVLGSWMLHRPPQPLNTLAWVGAAMLVGRPELLSNIGFQLTIAATAGILVMTPKLEAAWGWLPGWLRIPLSVSVGAHIAALPWTLSVFHLATPLSPLLNLIAVPWVAMTLSLALLWTVGAICLPPVAGLLDPLLQGSGRALAALAEMPPGWMMAIPSAVGWWTAVAWAAMIATVLLGTGWPRRTALIGCGCLLLVGDRLGPEPELVLLDVGQGDSILLRDHDEALLIDGGGWRRGDIAQKVLVPTLASLGLRRLSGIVLTHPDIDHCDGLLGLTSYIEVDRIYVSPGWTESKCARSMLTHTGLRVRALWRGEGFNLARWRISVLHPGAGRRHGRNNRSLVLLATAGRHRIVLTGDLERAGELEILQSGHRDALSSVDVLKVGHHGSATSTSSAWLERLRPRLALISCGSANRYGHPSAEVVDRLANSNIRVLRTDRDGGVRIVLPTAGNLRIHMLTRP